MNQVGKVQVMSGQVKSNKDWSSPFRTNQVKFEYFKTSRERSSIVRTIQVMLGKVRLNTSCFWIETFLDPNSFGQFF